MYTSLTADSEKIWVAAGNRSLDLGQNATKPNPSSIPVSKQDLVRDWAMTIWSMYNIYNVIDLENEFFLFRFSSEDDAIKVLTNGLWAFRGDLINLRPWKPDFKALTEEISSAPVWIQFPNLPME
ncbi:hypothetical protein Cni_G06640 [Canna indica]|uniref:DUF4283 domain-containing protein n=1 Tax=Canna indica TaxID=4628 RepID=A0AAQ3JXF7_9LILI|nr:hypothetical protein Cni_G06640 [Canna indica]